jgi:hypothetical protein
LARPAGPIPAVAVRPAGGAQAVDKLDMALGIVAVLVAVAVLVRVALLM